MRTFGQGRQTPEMERTTKMGQLIYSHFPPEHRDGYEEARCARSDNDADRPHFTMFLHGDTFGGRVEVTIMGPGFQADNGRRRFLIRPAGVHSYSWPGDYHETTKTRRIEGTFAEDRALDNHKAVASQIWKAVLQSAPWLKACHENDRDHREALRKANENADRLAALVHGSKVKYATGPDGHEALVHFPGIPSARVASGYVRFDQFSVTPKQAGRVVAALREGE